MKACIIVKIGKFDITNFKIPTIISIKKKIVVIIDFCKNN